MELTDFLLARIAEDEEAAHRAAEDVPLGEPWLAAWTTDAEGIGAEGWVHLDRWSPARVLAECNVKRWMFELVHVPFTADGFDDGPGVCCDECSHEEDGIYMAWPCKTMRLIALPYATHPDYQPDWSIPGLLV